MLREIKDKSKHVGQGCVWWDGKYDHRPRKVVIKGVKLIHVYRQGCSHRVEEEERVEFTIFCPELHGMAAVPPVELFDNFKACYKCIVEYSPFESLCNLSNYLGDHSSWERKKSLIKSVERAVDDI